MTPQDTDHQITLMRLTRDAFYLLGPVWFLAGIGAQICHAR